MASDPASLSRRFSSAIRNEDDLTRATDALRDSYRAMTADQRYDELIAAKDILYGASPGGTDASVAAQCNSDDTAEKHEYLLSMMQATAGELFSGTVVTALCQERIVDCGDDDTMLALFTIMARQETARRMAGTHPSPSVLQ